MLQKLNIKVNYQTVSESESSETGTREVLQHLKNTFSENHIVKSWSFLLDL